MTKRMSRDALRLYHGLGSPVEGYGEYGPGVSVTLVIGQTAGIDHGGRREGSKISEREVIKAVANRRIDQVKAAGLSNTIIQARGTYRGSPERSMRIQFFPDPDVTGESAAQFRKNISKLAQQVAGDLAQREVILEWNTGGKLRVDTASPVGAPPATEKPKFCAWVRKRSRSASTRKGDSCHASHFKKK